MSSERNGPHRSVDVLVFEVGGARCALPLDGVREVVRAVAVTALPKAPPIVEGIINVRGEVVPVLDIASRLGLAARPVTAAQRLVLANAAGRSVALRVDGIDWIAALDRDAIARPERIARGVGWLAGVGRIENELVLLHDLGSFLQQAESEALDAALAARADG